MILGHECFPQLSGEINQLDSMVGVAQWFPTFLLWDPLIQFLMLCGDPNRKLFLLLLHNWNFAIVMNTTVKGHSSRVETCCLQLGLRLILCTHSPWLLMSKAHGGPGSVF